MPEDWPGLRTHVVIKSDDGFQYLEVWDDEASWIAFRDTHGEPAVDEILVSYGTPTTTRW